MTHYDTLGVAETASQEEIKKAYRKLANQHHPDKGGDTNKFQQIQAAYDAIGDEQSRARYDQERHLRGQAQFGGVPPDIEDLLKTHFGFAFGQGFAAHGDPFASFRQPRKNKDIQIDLVVGLTSTLGPQTKTVNVQTANGTRFTVEVQIPRGIKSGSNIKYPGLGDNFFESLARGDLYVRIHVENDSEFQIHNLDLYKTVDINCLHAILGHNITVKAIDNRQFELTVPAGTQHGTKFRIPDHVYMQLTNHKEVH